MRGAAADGCEPVPGSAAPRQGGRAGRALCRLPCAGRRRPGHDGPDLPRRRAASSADRRTIRPNGLPSPARVSLVKPRRPPLRLGRVTWLAQPATGTSWVGNPCRSFVCHAPGGRRPGYARRDHARVRRAAADRLWLIGEHIGGRRHPQHSPASTVPASPVAASPGPAPRPDRDLPGLGPGRARGRLARACLRIRLRAAGDSTAILFDMTWSSWSATRAVGSGTYKIDACNPSCAGTGLPGGGGGHAEPAGEVLLRVRSRWDWSRAASPTPHGLPKALQGQTHLQNPWVFSTLVSAARQSCAA